MRLSISIPAALALASLPTLLAAPVPHGPGSPHFGKSGTLISRDGGSGGGEADIANAVHNAVDSAQAMSQTDETYTDPATGNSSASPDEAGDAVMLSHDDHSASAAVGKAKQDDDPETSAELGAQDAQALDSRGITTPSSTGTQTVRAFPRVVDSRQRRMKRAPMHLAWMTPRSDIWHTKRSPSNGVGKAMTNAERLANGMALLPPTKRSTAPHRRASQVPMTTRQNVVVHVVASDGTDLGTLTPSTGNGNGDGLLTFDPNTRTPIQFELPDGSSPADGNGNGNGNGHGNGGTLGGGPGAGGSFGPVGPQGPGNGNNGGGNPFEIRPQPQGGQDLFGGVGRQLLGAIPHLLGDGELKPGSPNFANLGMGQCDQGNPLNLNLPPLPLIDQVGGLLSGLPKLLGKIPGLLNLNLGGGGGDGGNPSGGDGAGGAGGPLGGLGGLGGLRNLGGLGGLGELTQGSLGGILHIVGPGAGTGSGSGPIDTNGAATSNQQPTQAQDPSGTSHPSTDPEGNNNQSTNPNDGNDEGLLGLHLPSQLLGLAHPPSSPAPLTPGAEQGAHSHSEPSTGAGFPLDSDKLSQPVSQPAQSAIWHCDERGNMGASWTNPDGSKVPARFFTGGPCAHTICLAADVEALKAVHGGDLAEVHLVAGLL